MTALPAVDIRAVIDGALDQRKRVWLILEAAHEVARAALLQYYVEMPRDSEAKKDAALACQTLTRMRAAQAERWHLRLCGECNFAEFDCECAEEADE